MRALMFALIVLAAECLLMALVATAVGPTNGLWIVPMVAIAAVAGIVIARRSTLGP